MGWLSLDTTASNPINGQWSLEGIGDPDVIGPQDGNGTLQGWLTGDTLWVNLQPQIFDNNIYLSGSFQAEQFSGIWLFATAAGLTAEGTFEAIRR